MNSNIKTRVIIFFVVLFVALAFLAPTLDRETFGKGWISKPLSLGLDLSGGVYLVYEVQTKEAVKSKLQVMANNLKAKLLEKKVPVLRPKINDANQIEVVLVSELSLENAKKTIADEFRELSFIEKRDDSGKVKLLYEIPAIEAERIEKDSVVQAVENLRNRVDQFGVSEPLIQKVGEKRILLQMPGVSDIESVKRVVGSVAKLEFRFLPSGMGREGTITLKNKEGQPVALEDPPVMTGDAVETARVDPTPGQIEVLLTLNKDGARTFGKLTADNVGRNLAIILDGVVHSSPEIKSAIPNGQAVISGGFTFEEARQLAVVLRAGALPAPLVSIEERKVGATLGKESIEKGVLAILIGVAMIFVFMLVYYKKAGIIADASLLLNLILILALLSAFGATLTLPGLAGLALTVGMAVDSNVIIFERIRDELRNGSSRDAAVSAGFDKALSAILDSNVTTLVAGLILYYFGTGPIKGFAVTLCVGILTTIYCAIFASHLAFDYFDLRGKDRISI